MIARNTAFTYKGKPVDVKQIGRELGVRYVLEGSVRRTGDQVQVNVQLIDAETGAHVWADRFDTDRRNLAEAQSEITGRLARTLNVELVQQASRRIEQEKAADPDARDLVIRATGVGLPAGFHSDPRRGSATFRAGAGNRPAIDRRKDRLAELLVTTVKRRMEQLRSTRSGARRTAAARSPRARCEQLVWRMTRWASSAEFRTDWPKRRSSSRRR